MKAYTLLILVLTTAIYSCGQQNPMQTDSMAAEVEAVATRSSVYQSLNSGSLPDHLSLTLIQRNNLQTITTQDILNRKALIEATYQGQINYNTFTQHKHSLDQIFSNTFLDMLTSDQVYRYDIVRSDALNAHYTTKTDHIYWNVVKLVERIDD